MDTSLENSSDLQSQFEEIEALSSIYGDEWCVIDEASRIFCIRISEDIHGPKWSVCLQISLPENYPNKAPPKYQINAGWLRGPDRIRLSNCLEELYLQNAGESILYLWVEKIREFLIERTQANTGPDTNTALTTEEEVAYWDDFDISDFSALKLNTEHAHLFSSSSADEELPPIKHGETITDRRSSFQAHLAPVLTSKQIKMVIDQLYGNKKIAGATHNIYAYRIYCEDKRMFLQDCEDDGETAAGGRLLHLLQILDVRNVLVVVSRWYGGILLGPDRFKHINNCARNILIQEGYLESMDEGLHAGGKSRKSKIKKMK
ncbi:protein IMPACT isoform X2 [Hoplias malabaricus]|uniref:protein IMPACT isoform X2 n=1 Tax=Hoplias malabaricus TaxID=27720 RepID=UPI00346320E4